MKDFSGRISTLFLAFAVGTASASAVIYKVQANQITEPSQITQTETVKDNGQKTLEMVFVLDTTGSMGGLIEGAKTKIWSIVNDVMQRKDRPKVKIGLVAYRDNGDAYVTQVTPLTEDLDKIYSTLMDFRAEGGGDTPENVRRALAEGVDKAGWAKTNPNTAQILFLVGDAPPHNDYVQEPDVLVTTAKAVSQNMIVNTIQCGNLGGTKEVWQTIAQRGEGKYFAIAQDGGVQAISTPYDVRLAELANKLGGTYLAYGGGAGAAGERFREDSAKKQAATESKVLADAPMAAQADRAMNKAINSAAYSNDLIQSIENESVKLEDVKDEDLPENLKKMSLAERKKEVEKRLAERKAIRAEILELSKKRDEFIKAERAKLGKQDGFDAAVSNALSEQMLRKGIK
ncbi:MAG: VWA domain-containing protein [Pyrinomonadaceae bacterium]|nr:VWA domain-containing protein [Pyrinomonadaceae bacterium]